MTFGMAAALGGPVMLQEPEQAARKTGAPVAANTLNLVRPSLEAMVQWMPGGSLDAPCAVSIHPIIGLVKLK